MTPQGPGPQRRASLLRGRTHAPSTRAPGPILLMTRFRGHPSEAPQEASLGSWEENPPFLEEVGLRGRSERSTQERPQWEVVQTASGLSLGESAFWGPLGVPGLRPRLCHGRKAWGCAWS